MAKTIMIVDDSASLRQVVSISLRGAGYDVIEGSDGVDALKKLTGQKVHLIISDVNMPNMDGISLVKKVKEMPTYRFTPIVMLTTESQDEKKREGQAAGAKAWVLKPFNPRSYCQSYRNWCCLERDVRPDLFTRTCHEQWDLRDSFIAMH